MTPDNAGLREAILSADPRLSKYNPLSRILFYDDFDEGVNGWCELVGNHTGDLDEIREIARDFRPPQLSTCTFFDIGTHGSVEGTYSLKLATRPQHGHVAIAIKRLTYGRRGLVQFETYFSFKAEQTFGADPSHGEWDGNIAPSEKQFGDITFSNDICDGDTGARYMGAVRYLNTDTEGNLAHEWMYRHPCSQRPRWSVKGSRLPTRTFTQFAPATGSRFRGASATVLQRNGFQGELALPPLGVRH